MAVLQHEGTHTILFGRSPILVGSATLEAYLARPDSADRSGVVIVLHGIGGLDSTAKGLCRSLARHGFTAVAPDWYRGVGPRPGSSPGEAFGAYHATTDEGVLSLIDETIEYMSSEDVAPADASSPIVVGFDLGGRFALLHAARDRSVAAVVSVYAPLHGDEDRRQHVMDAIPLIGAPLLGLYGADDELIPVADVDAAQAVTPNGQWIVYEQVGHDFLDADGDGYDPGAEADALLRLVRMAELASS